MRRGIRPICTTVPQCSLTAVIPGPPKRLQITVQDPDDGLQSIVVTSAVNASVPVPAFAPGETNPVVVTATKIDQGKSASVALQITDVHGNVTNCDPLIPEERPAAAASGSCNTVPAELVGLLGLLSAAFLLRRRR